MTRLRQSRAFTLVEVLIGSTLAAVVMLALLASFVYLGRSLAQLVNYQNLEAKAREALTYLRTDFGQAECVRTATTPTATTLTLVLPSGEVTYTYDAVNQLLRRRTNFGNNQDFNLLQNATCSCTAFSFDYFTATDGDPTSQFIAGAYTPYSIKQVQVRFTVQTVGTSSPSTRATFPVTSTRFMLRNRQEPDGN